MADNTNSSDMGWLGALAAGLTAFDPSGQAAKSFSTAFQKKMEENKNSGGDDESKTKKGADGGDDTAGSPKPSDANPYAPAGPADPQDDSDVDPDNYPGAPDYIVPSTPKAPQSSLNMLFPESPIAIPGKPAVPSVAPPNAQISAPSLIKPVQAPPKAPAVPVALHPAIMSAIAPQGVDAADVLDDMSNEHDVWGGEEKDIDDSIGQLSKSIKAYGLGDPRTAMAFRNATPSLRTYANSPNADPDNKKYAANILNAYSATMGGAH